MTKSLNNKANYQARREMRLRRDKIAGDCLAALLTNGPRGGAAVQEAVKWADDLIAELDKGKEAEG